MPEPQIRSRSSSGWSTLGCSTRSGVHGLYARGAAFEHVRLAFDALVTRTAAPESAEPMYFPPLLPREQLETNGYLGSFPHLAGTVFAFEGDEAAGGRAARLAAGMRIGAAFSG